MFMAKGINTKRGQVVDHTGKRYGNLVGIKYVGYLGAAPAWLWQCDCGKQKIILTQSVVRISKRPGTSSCGCQQFKRRLAPGEANFKAYLWNMKNNARRRGYPFELTIEEVKRINKLNCSYCGREPYALYDQAHTHNKRTGKTYRNYGAYGPYNGIDRMDNSKGYSLTNCAPCCQQCQTMKMDYSISEFIQHCVRIAKFSSLSLK